MPEHATTPPDEPEAEQRPDDHVGEHEAPDGAPLHPLIDLSRDPTPGKPSHARDDD